MYLIVLFEEDNKTGPVAKEWFSDGLAWWPPYRDKCQILRTVQKKVVPNPSKGWRQFAARVLYESGNFHCGNMHLSITASGVAVNYMLF